MRLPPSDLGGFHDNTALCGVMFEAIGVDGAPGVSDFISSGTRIFKNKACKYMMH